MKRQINLIFWAVLAIAVSGCYTTGLSMRETGQFNYSNLIYGLYDESDSAAKQEVLDKPIKLAVAQVGENAPPVAMLNALAEQKYLISKVSVIPAGGSETNYGNNQNNTNKEEFNKRMVKMRKLAKDLGANYIFLFGGSADYGYTANWLQFFDITLVGGYILPSNKITAEGRAAGALISVETGRVVFLVNSEAKKQARSATFTVDSRQEEVVVKLRDDLVVSLADEFIEKLKM